MSISSRAIICGGLALAGIAGPVDAAKFQSFHLHHCGGGGSFYDLRFGFGNMDLSADGKVIVYGAESVNACCEAFRWTADDGVFEWLGFYDPIAPHEDYPRPMSRATATSADGSVVVGSSLVDWYHVLGEIGGLKVEEISGFEWRDGVYTRGLPWPGGYDEAYPLDLSADGNVAVGASWELDCGIPFVQLYYCPEYVAATRWVDGVPHHITALGSDGMFFNSGAYAVAVSDDGQVVVGQSGKMEDYWRPFIWYATEHETYPLEVFNSAACAWGEYGSCNAVQDVSGDGRVAVGHLDDGTNVVPVYWDTTTRLPTVLPLLGGDTEGGARGVSEDGETIVGWSGDRGAIWKKSLGYTAMSLETLLRSVRLGEDIAISGTLNDNIFRPDR